MARRKRTSRTDPRLRKPESKRRAKLIGARLLARRMELGLSQTKVASKLGWHPSRLWEYESGRSMPRTNALYALADALGLSFAELSAMRNGGNGNGGES